MAVITISRQLGSGGLDIAMRVSELLGYRYFDKRLLTEVMAQEGFTNQTVIDYREDEYRLRGFVDRILGYRRPKTIADLGFWDDNPEAMKATSVAVLDEHLAVWLVRRAIEVAHQQGNVVIVGRGGAISPMCSTCASKRPWTCAYSAWSSAATSAPGKPSITSRRVIGLRPNISSGFTG